VLRVPLAFETMSCSFPMINSTIKVQYFGKRGRIELRSTPSFKPGAVACRRQWNAGKALEWAEVDRDTSARLSSPRLQRLRKPSDSCNVDGGNSFLGQVTIDKVGAFAFDFASALSISAAVRPGYVQVVRCRGEATK
jgi:hypothetical protein